MLKIFFKKQLDILHFCKIIVGKYGKKLFPFLPNTMTTRRMRGKHLSFENF